MRSLRSKYILFIVVILTVLLIMLNILPITSVRNTVFVEKHSAMYTQAVGISSALSRLERLSAEGIADALKFFDLETYNRITVCDRAGNVLYDAAEPGMPPFIPEQAYDGKAMFLSVFRDNVFLSSIAVPIGTREAVSGILSLSDLDQDRADLILRFQRVLLLISLAVGIASVFLAVLFSHFVLRRLNDLTQSMHIVASGNYSHRHRIRGRDELSTLSTEFNALTERLETSEELRRRFVSDASHELKTPLASIRLLSDSILQNDGMNRKTVMEFVSDIGLEAQRLQRTAEELLDLSRLEDGVEVAPVAVDLKQITLDAIKLLVPLAAERRVSLRSELDDGCVILSNSDAMSHVVYNLIENAIKYNVPSGSVLIRLWQDTDSVDLSVEDTGIGIPDRDMHSIFDRFYRVDKARSRESGGSGLGLSIVRENVTAWGGTVRVAHNSPQGSVFTVSFPRPEESTLNV